MPAEVTSVPIVLQSMLGHLEYIAKTEPERSLTEYQVSGFNWLLEGGHTVEEALDRLRAMADVVLV
jgi:hypothetical protein